MTKYTKVGMEDGEILLEEESTSTSTKQITKPKKLEQLNINKQANLSDIAEREAENTKIDIEISEINNIN